MLKHPKLQNVYAAMHGRKLHERQKIVAEAVAADVELAALFRELREQAGESASTSRPAASVEERRIELFVLDHQFDPDQEEERR